MKNNQARSLLLSTEDKGWGFNTEWFFVQDSVIHARVMLRDFRKA